MTQNIQTNFKKEYCWKIHPFQFQKLPQIYTNNYIEVFA